MRWAILPLLAAFLAPTLAGDADRRLVLFLTLLFVVVFFTTMCACGFLPRAVFCHMTKVLAFYAAGYNHVVFDIDRSKSEVDPSSFQNVAP